MPTPKQHMRRPVVAGMFYPGTRHQLSETINHYFHESSKVAPEYKKLYGLISPHAGYVYSGIVAAAGFKLLKGQALPNVVVIAPCHSEYFKGFSIFGGSAYETPLGSIEINRDICDRLCSDEVAYYSDSGHRNEHALEVQLPFLQVALDGPFQLVPVVMGDNSVESIRKFADALARVAEKHEFLVVASSDLSHYHSYDLAARLDRHFIALVESYDLEALEKGYKDRSLEACGLGPVLALMHYAKSRGKPHCTELDYRNSGDTSGMKSQVVGYLSAAVYE